MPRLEIEVAGHLLVAGVRARTLGVDLATARRWHEGRWVPYVPATALRGAIRMQLEALLAGAGRDATHPYPFEPDDDPEARRPSDLVARLFGYSGPDGRRDGAREGKLRVSDALPVDPAKAAACFAVRPGVELDDARATAADRKLFFREVAETSSEPLVLSATLDTGGAGDTDLTALRAAVETTDAIGAGKSSGGGEVVISWHEGGQSPGVVVTGDPGTAARARVVVTLSEPAHFGAGGPQGFHHATRTFLPGSTLRGALAWALVRAGKTDPDASEGFRALFLDEASPVSFGDGLLAHGEAEPQIVPATGRTERGSGRWVDVLAAELAREQLNPVLAGHGLHLASDDGTARLDSLPARPGEELLVTTRTRVSLSRARGTAEDQRLFSIEQVEPWLPPDPAGRSRRARFVAWIEGLAPAAASELAKLDGVPVLVGAGRNHGLGLAEVHVELLPGLAAKDTGAVERLEREVAAELSAQAREAGLAEPPPLGPERWLALTASSDFVPSADEPHPLAALAPEAGEPVRSFLTAGVTGGYDQRPKHRKGAGGGSLRTLRPAVGAGSVYVYRLAAAGFEELLGRVLPALRHGVGGRRESGCGRFGLFEPAQQKEDREMTTSVDLSADLKRRLIGRIETEIPFGKIDRNKRRDGTSQLRNLVNVSQRETEVAVLVNFIQYQAARQATKGFWQPIHREVIKILRDLDQQPDLTPDVKARAIQHFFGYLVRHYVYWSFQERQDDEQEGGEP